MPKRWTITTESVTVTVDKTLISDPQEDVQRPAVIITMPGFVAHSLAHVLANWSRCVELAGGEYGEEALAAILHAAARETGLRETTRCHDDPPLPVEAVLINSA
jgi:hypothetical protein